MGDFSNVLNYSFIIKNPKIEISSTPDPEIVKEQETKERIIEGLESLLQVWS